VSHNTAAATLSATSPGIPSLQRSRQPTRFATTTDSRKSLGVAKTRGSPAENPFLPLLIFLGFLLIF
jgi:hypothetical protein